MRSLFALVVMLFAESAGGVSMDWVRIGEPGNPTDTPANCGLQATTCGSVAYRYSISKYEVTNTQYADFLNAVDPSGNNSLALYSSGMDTDASGGIRLVPGNASGAKYVVKPGFANKPVAIVTFYDALRFTNWLNNGQGSGDTESGAYTLLGGTPTPSNGPTVTRNPGAITFLPNESEWYKAAFFDGTSYFAYPTGTDTPTSCAAPGATPNTANCRSVVGATTDVGAYTASASPYGTFDQAGNVSEWTEEITSVLGVGGRAVRGGNYFFEAGGASGSWSRSSIDPRSEAFIGFRVASLVPEPATGLLVFAGLVGLAARSGTATRLRSARSRWVRADRNRAEPRGSPRRQSPPR